MHKKSIRFSVFASLVLGLAYSISGCGPNSPIPITPLKIGEMSATVSGFGTFYASNSVVDSTNTLFHIHASMQNNQNNDSLVIDILVSRNASFPYSIDVSSNDNSKIAYCIIKPDGSCKNYSADKGNGGSGQIRISNMSPTLQGTYSGTLLLVGGTESVSISEGGFNAGYK